MKILERYILREISSHALLGLLVFSFVLFTRDIVRLMELFVRHTTSTGTIARLFAAVLPGIFTFTLPMAVLVGILIGLSRMSADSEIVALRAAGIGVRRFFRPVLSFALLGAAFTLLMTVALGPRAARTLNELETALRSQASYEVQPRVFEERFPNLVFYVQDVEAGRARWKGIFLADVQHPNGTRVTLAESSIVVNDPKRDLLQLHLLNGSTHEFAPGEPDRYSISTFSQSDLPIELAVTERVRSETRTNAQRSMLELLAAPSSAKARREALVEFHRRLAFPAACLVLALVAIPIGVASRKGGKSVGFVLTLLLVSGYYLLFVAGVGLARQEQLSPATGVWGANLLFALLGVVLVTRTEKIPRERSWVEYVPFLRAAHETVEATTAEDHERPRHHEANPVVLKREVPLAAPHFLVPSDAGRNWTFPQILDLYLLRGFLFYFLLLLAGFVLLFHTFTFFELIDDIAKYRVPWRVLFDYFRYLTPQIVYMTVPLAALVAILIEFGLLSKSNEITAIKASGVSLYRLSMPVLAVALGLAALLFLFDSTYLPYANQRQDALRNQIKGRPAQTFYRPERKWIFGESTRIFNYSFFDPDSNFFGGLSVYELDPATFALRRRIHSNRVRWAPHLGAWVFEDGWVRDFQSAAITNYVRFTATTFPELAERPAYFKKEVRQSSQMSWRELGAYIRDLRQSGFDVVKLSVQWHKKFAFPLITVIIVLLGIPFSFSTGRRGALGGIAASLAIGIVYWALAGLFEAMGGVGQLPPVLAAWGPDLAFGFAGIYLFLRMPT